MFAEFTQTKSDKLFFYLFIFFYMRFTTAHIKEMEFDDLHF